MSISLRILLGFALTTLLTVVIALYALGEVAAVRDMTANIVSRDLAAFRQIDDAHDAMADMAELRLGVLDGYLRRVLAAQGSSVDRPGLDGAPEGLAHWEERAAAAEGLILTARQSVSNYAASAKDVSRRDAWASIGAALGNATAAERRVRQDTETMFAAMRRGDTQAVLAENDAVASERGAFDQAMATATSALSDSVAAGQAYASRLYNQTRLSLAIALLAAVAVAGLTTWAVRRSITRPLFGLVDLAGRVGAGDLSVRAEENANNELGRLGISFNAMIAGLRETIRHSRDATENLNVAVAEIRASTQEQAAGVEEQLAAVQQTAATVDEITHSGSQISRRAQEVIESAQATALASASGLHAVQESGRAMEQVQAQGEAVAANIVALSEKTQAIGEIVSSVNDISERTHLLALNAALEAASAGEQGRSFAVVASEMKLLADQAKDATQQVRSILGDIGRGINTSVMLTEEAVKRGAAGRERTETAQATIEEMAAGIQEAVQTFQQIVASTNQQQLGIEQVMTALQNIRQASQQTAAGTRQLDAAALSLGRLSGELTSAADRFRL